MKPYFIHPQDPGPAVLPDDHYLMVAKALCKRLQKNWYDQFSRDMLNDCGSILRGRILTRLYGEYDPDRPA